MISKRLRLLVPALFLALVASLVPGISPAANTDGLATFTVTLNTPVTGATYGSAHIDAVWIEDSAGHFIQTILKYQGGNTSDLTQWYAQRGGFTGVDGITSATVSGTKTWTLTWHCRGTNNLVVPDGTYYVRAEYASTDGNGPYMASAVSFVKGPAAVNATYPDFSIGGGRFSAMSLTYAPLAASSADIAITGMTTLSALAGSTATVQVLVANLTTNAATFSVALSNVTAAPVLIGSQQVSALAGNAATTLTFNWNTVGLAIGTYRLSAMAGPLAGEVNVADNVMTNTVTLRAPIHDVAVTALAAPGLVLANATTNITVTVANLGDYAETFGLTLSDATAAQTIGARTLTGLAAGATTNAVFPWNTAGTATGSHALQAVAATVAGETNMGNNTYSAVSVVTTGAGTNAATDGMAIFSVTTMDYAGVFNPNHVAAIWVTDGAGRFVKTLSRHAGIRIGYLQQWAASRGAYTNVDGVTSATLTTQPYPETVTWNCRDINNAIMPDGVYYFYAEYTSDNGQGPYLSNAVSFVKGPVPFNATYPDRLDAGGGFTAMSVTYTPLAAGAHDIAVTALGPPTVDPETTVPMVVTITNLQALTEAFTVTLSNVTQSASVGSAAALLAGGASAGIVIPWSTVGLVPGNYSLKAVAGPVPNEGNTANNTLTATVTVRPVLHDIGVTAVDVQGDATVGDIIDTIVTAANLGNVPETFSVTLRDATAGRTIGTLQASNLAAQASVQLIFGWNTVGSALGPHTLTARASSVAGEINTANNSLSTTGMVSTTGFTLSALNALGSVGGHCGAVAVLTAQTNQAVREGETEDQPRPQAVQPTAVLAGFGSALSVLTIDPSSGAPSVVGSVRLPGIVNRIAVAGTTAYTASGDAGVHVVDLSNRAAPVHRNTYKTTGNANAVCVLGSTLYVAEGGYGFRIMSISSPLTPALRGAYKTEGPVQALAAAGTTLYVVDRYAGLEVFDVSTRSAPRLQGICRIGFANDVAVAGTMAYVVDDSGTLTAVNVATPTAPVAVGSFALAGPGKAIALADNTAYVSAGNAGLQIVSVATPAVPVFLADAPMPGEAVGVAVADPLAFVASGFGGFRVVDASVPISPVIRAGYLTGHRAVDVTVLGRRAYVAAGEGGVDIYSVTNPALPVLLGVCGMSGNARNVAVSGPLAYIADGQYGLTIVDVSTPALTVFRGSYAGAGMGPLRRVAVSGSTALITDGHRIQRLDVTDPAKPVLTASYAVPGYAFDLAVSGPLAAVASGGSGLLVLNIAGRSQLAYIGRFATPGPALAVRLSGATAYVGEGKTGWQIVDLARPAAPALVSSFTAPAFGLSVAGSNVTVVAPGGLTATGVSAPLTPVALTNVGPLVNAMRTAAFGQYALAAQEDAGVAILNVGGGQQGTEVTDPSVANDVGTLWAQVPDAWKQQIVDASIAANGAIRTLADVQPNDDFDGDGLSNLQEYLAGTSPIDPHSVFALALSVTPPTGGTGESQAGAAAQYVVRWNSEAGKSYTLYRSVDLLAGWTPVQIGIPAAPPVNSYTDTVTATGAFYMVGVQ